MATDDLRSLRDSIHERLPTLHTSRSGACTLLRDCLWLIIPCCRNVYLLTLVELSVFATSWLCWKHWFCKSLHFNPECCSRTQVAKILSNWITFPEGSLDDSVWAVLERQIRQTLFGVSCRCPPLRWRNSGGFIVAEIHDAVTISWQMQKQRSCVLARSRVTWCFADRHTQPDFEFAHLPQFPSWFQITIRPA